MENTIKLIEAAVEKYRDSILEAERYIWNNPETGFKEWKTDAYLKAKYKELGYTLHEAGNIPGFYVDIDTGREGPCVLVLGEMDSVICPEHPEADKETGAVHACGHNTHSAALYGIAAALKEEGMLDKMCGKIKLCAVPAEELLEIEYRANLKKQGIIKYFGGKGEFLHRGYFDDVDMAFMVHASGSFSIIKGSHVGCIAKTIIYKGKAAHAGGAPHLGRNALYAATCGLNAVNAIRETFLNMDYIRVHPIMTAGGNMVNAIPSEARLESYVRGKTFDAIKKVNRKVNQALVGAALSLGTNIEIIDYPGYSPTIQDHNLADVFAEAAAAIIPQYQCKVTYSIATGSTDMGDLSALMPVQHGNAAGCKGTGHGMDYYIVDPVAACVDSAKLQIMMLNILLGNNAERAKSIIAEYKPQFASKEEFLAYVDSLNDSGDRIEYLEDGTAKVRIDK
ncbi:MAG: amidohydrolase [Ruminococcaceae bacterium]|nr:amidohydrolase [Oscillospiraceae bacterium]